MHACMCSPMPENYNSLWPNDVMWCHKSWLLLVQEMAWHMFSAKSSPKPMLTYEQLEPQEQTSVKFKSKYFFFFQENVFKNVCKVVAILLMWYCISSLFGYWTALHGQFKVWCIHLRVFFILFLIYMFNVYVYISWYLYFPYIMLIYIYLFQFPLRQCIC